MHFLKQLFLLAFLTLVLNANAQVVINEVASSNNQFYPDEFDEFPDWIELLNPGTSTINIGGWALTDDATWNKWILPSMNLNAGERKIIFASGRNLNGYSTETTPNIDHWETAVFEESNWQYFVGSSAPSSNWTTDVSNTSAWQTASGGFGYGDGDDITPVPDGTPSIYIRHTFNVSDPSQLAACIFSLDFDDAFVAYLNGTEISRFGLTGTPDNNTLSEQDHEAVMYAGGLPEQFYIGWQDIQNLLISGNNILSIEVHNVSLTSSDLSCRPWLHFGITSSQSLFNENPLWFVAPNGNNTTQNLHTNFSISNNETVRLFNANGVEQDAILMNAQSGHSRARIPDAGPWCYTDTPTPNASNSGTCYVGYASAPNILPSSGFYPSNLVVSMTGTNTKYTLDGSDPDELDFTYTAPFNIDQTLVVRARRFEVGKLPSAITSRTYLLNDPTTLPVVSIISNPGNLFNDGSGGPAVYDNSQGFQQANTTNCTIQYFDANHEFQFESPASLTPVGNFSLDFAQKSLQFKYDEDYGASSDITYNIFSKDKPFLGASHGFRVRNTDDDYYGARMRDLVINRMSLDTYSGAAAYQNVTVYINGEYWGHYGAREMLNKYFMRDNYGASKDSVDMIKNAYPSLEYLVEEGNSDDFYEMSDFVINNDMSNPDNFEIASSFVDVKNFVDYLAGEIYCNNQDWFPSAYFNNTRLSQDASSNIPWKYILWDVGYSQGIGGGFYDDLLYSTLGGPYYENIHTSMMNSLLVNDSFGNYFINRFADLLNWHWTTEKVHAIIDDCAAELTPEISRQNDAWGSGDLDTWLGQVDYLKSFHEIRPSIQRDQIENYFGLVDQVDITLNVLPEGAGVVKISTIIPDEYPWTGIYFNGNPVQITAIANPGFSFDHWSASAFIADANHPSFNSNITESTVFTAFFTGAIAAIDVQVTEINYNNDPSITSGDWVEIYNNGITEIDLSDCVFKDANFYNHFPIPTETRIGAGEFLVIAENLTLFQTQHPEVTNVVGSFNFNLNNAGELIELHDLAGNVIFSFAYDDAISWPCTADGHGRTLERKTPFTNPGLGTSWFDGCIGGSPGHAFIPCTEGILISEINYSSSLSANAGDWFELHNTTASTIDLNGWKVTDGDNNEFVINGTSFISENGYKVITQDPVAFNTQFPFLTNLIGPIPFGLASSSDILKIYDASGKLRHSVCYKSVAPWPTSPNGGGYTLEYNSNFNNVNDGNSWFAGCLNGSPGSAYDPSCNPCISYGCTDSGACNFNLNAQCDDGSCAYPQCSDPDACNYNPNALCAGGICTYPGCNDPLACNYAISAACDDGSCLYPGCTDVLACNYNALAACDDGSCVSSGCTNEDACNFSPSAGCDDGTCIFNTYYEDADGDGFGNPNAPEYSCLLPNGFVTDQSDCDDSNPLVYPDASGTYDGIDNNCNGDIDPTEIYICFGDFNLDGIVGVGDFYILMGEFNCTANCSTDLNFDGAVNIEDIMFFITVFGTDCN
jgi:hypothetical protein